MPGCIRKLLEKVVYRQPPSPVHAPHQWNKPAFGQHIQRTTPEDSTEFLPKDEIKLIQTIVGALLYYTCAVDPPMFPVLNKILITQAAPTQVTLKNVTIF